MPEDGIYTASSRRMFTQHSIRFQQVNNMNLSELEMESITGEMVSFSEYRDQALLIVNLASQWGLTPQYAGLRTLQENNPNLRVLGFPCNQFGAQEPGSNEEILEFAKSKYDVNFPMFAKIEVNGPNAVPLYTWLKAEALDEEGNADIPWNFTKFLVSADGKTVKRFHPKVTPEEIGATL